MKWVYGFLTILCFSQFECGDTEGFKCHAPCSQTATVKDLSGLDGCKFALEMEDGTRLVPQFLSYVQPPRQEDDPGYYFQFKDGQKVCFGFREVNGADICMAGKMVFLTCIKVCDDQGKN
jgi:hypothetical protein